MKAPKGITPEQWAAFPPDDKIKVGLGQYNEREAARLAKERAEREAARAAAEGGDGSDAA